MSTDAEPGPKLAAIRREGYFGGAGLLAADARVASLFADEARRRTMRRLFGIPAADASGLATLIALVTLGEAVRRQMGRLHTPGPSVPGVLTGVGLVKELAYDVAGPWSRESSYFGTLLALALMGATARAAARASTRRVRSFSRQGYSEFAHRYGHLVRPNRGDPSAT